MSESYDVGTRAWQPDPTEGWVASEVIKKTVDGSKVTLEFQLENGEVGIFGLLRRSWMLLLSSLPLSADQDARGLPGGPPVRQRPVAAAPDEPYHARSQR